MNIQTTQPTTTKQFSPVLSRLMEEVKNNKNNVNGAYDRTHNRHNRGQ
ncbi:YhhA family cyclophane-containing RiPP [Vibrio echinoideorum]|nr:YhhA family cyclophane-containing RiPP [Vibrio echinoideorum]